MNIEEGKNMEIGKLCRKELAWIEKLYDEDPLDPWINGYRNALRTVLRHANRNVLTEKFPVLETCKEDMKEEFEASEKTLIDIEQFSKDQMRAIAAKIGDALEEGYWAALHIAVEEELNAR